MELFFVTPCSTDLFEVRDFSSISCTLRHHRSWEMLMQLQHHKIVHIAVVNPMFAQPNPDGMLQKWSAQVPVSLLKDGKKVLLQSSSFRYSVNFEGNTLHNQAGWASGSTTTTASHRTMLELRLQPLQVLCYVRVLASVFLLCPRPAERTMSLLLSRTHGDVTSTEYFILQETISTDSHKLSATTSKKLHKMVG